MIQEAEFQTIASETLRGISRSSSGMQGKDQTYFGQLVLQSSPKGQQKGRNQACKISTSFPAGSHLTALGERGETLVWSGHMYPRIWEVIIKLLKGGAP